MRIDFEDVAVVFMGLLLAFFLVSICFSFLCSIMEAVLLSVTPTYVGVLEKQGSGVAADLAAYKEDIDRPLAAILTLNTIAHTVGAIGVGAQAAVLFPHSEISLFGVGIALNWEAIVAVIMTLAILIFSEVIPKTIGANNWEALAPATTRTLKVMLIVLWPLVWLSQFITGKLKKDKDRPVLSRTDLAVMTDIGTETGVLAESERKIIHNLLAFRGIQAADVMTPRIVVVAASEDTGLREFHDSHDELPFSRIPVYQGKNDNVTGYVLKDEVLLKLVDEHDEVRLKDLRRDIIAVHKTATVPDLLDMFIAKKEHLAVVVDEFGAMEGILTMEDIIETLLGLEIVDESDDTEDMQALARRNWNRRARKLGIIPLEQSNPGRTGRL